MLSSFIIITLPEYEIYCLADLSCSKFVRKLFLLDRHLFHNKLTNIGT